MVCAINDTNNLHKCIIRSKYIDSFILSIMSKILYPCIFSLNASCALFHCKSENWSLCLDLYVEIEEVVCCLELEQNTTFFSPLNLQHYLPIKFVLGPSIDQNLAICCWYTTDVHLPAYMWVHALILRNR